MVLSYSYLNSLSTDFVKNLIKLVNPRLCRGDYKNFTFPRVSRILSYSEPCKVQQIGGEKHFTNWQGQRESKIVEGHVYADHIHIVIEIPPKYTVSAVVGYITKTSLRICRGI
jgi:hypothetical protein